MNADQAAYRRRIVDHQLDGLLGGVAAVALEGAKAVGKTATASMRASRTFRMDDPEQLSIVEADPSQLVRGPDPVLIDEWQWFPSSWDRVRRAVDDGAPPGSFLLTGSSSPVRGGTHSGAGRIVSVRMRPMALTERLDASPTVSVAELLSGRRAPIEGESDVGLDAYVDEILRSGFPGLRGMGDEPLHAQLDGYLSHVVDRDFPELGYELRNPAALRRWMSAYAAATATVASFETIRDAATAGVSDKPARSTVTPYRDTLERLFLIEPLPAWIPSRNHIARLAHPPKHHLVDPALAAQLVGATHDSLLTGHAPAPRVPRDGTFLGSLFESLVTQSIRVYAQASGVTVGHLRTHGGAHEIDLIVGRRDGRVLALEVKLGAIPDDGSIRHLTWLREQIGDDLLDAAVVTTGSAAYRRQDGIAVIPVALLGP